MLSLVVVLLSGLGLEKTSKGLASDRGLIDFVSAPPKPPSTNPKNPDFNLAGSTSADLCLTKIPHPQTRFPETVALGCKNAPVFADLSRAGNQKLWSKYGNYQNHAKAKFFYQWKLGGVDTNLFVLNRRPGMHPTSDSLIAGQNLENLYAGVTLMTRILQKRSIDVYSCAIPKITTEVPTKYQSQFESKPFLGVVETSFVSDVDNLMSQQKYIAIGAFQQSLAPGANASGAFTYSQPLSVAAPIIKQTMLSPAMRRGGLRIPAIYKDDTDLKSLIALSFNTNDLAESSPARVAGVMFHELLHNIGFQHSGNNPADYVNRGKAILALEDCMEKEALKSMNVVGSASENNLASTSDLKD
ncbi:hypothetical protein QUA54_32200 [Microcoleus sp. MOSTC5]|uniref:hypothetical protein n=1 Tax=Microcoleus sp. MOSTC5 TaxID=3055378 RepID=UPI002FCED95A